MAQAAIDLGSNSVILLVMDQDTILCDDVRVVGLGKGLGDGGDFQPGPMEATREALRDFVRIAKTYGVLPASIDAVSTSAARRAKNAGSFFASIEHELGLTFRVISGDEEAALTWTGARSGLSVFGSTMVVDLGGGSTELVVGTDTIEWRHSYELGSVRLTERVLGPQIPPASRAHLDHMKARCKQVFSEPHCTNPVHTVVGVAGSVTTLAAAALGLTVYDGARVHGSTLTDAHLAAFQEALLLQNSVGRRAVFVASPARADYLLAGATILREALTVAGCTEMLVSDRGLRYGLLQ